jgi:hypothetical protein
MSEDSYTEITSQSWFGRIGDSIKGIFFGLLLLIGAFVLLWWNEGRTLDRYKALQEGAGAVIPVASNAVDAANESKLVYVSGPATTTERVADPEFGVSAAAIKIIRKVNMYQWAETKRSTTRKTLGGGSTTETTYSYNKTWSEELIDSGAFRHPEGHRNPAEMAFKSRTFAARKVKLGAFTLSPSLVEKMNKSEELNLGDYASPSASRGRAKIYDGGYYIGNDPDYASIGDLKVSFKLVLPSDISVISGQVRDTFAPYSTKAGGSIELLETGIFPQQQMFKHAESQNQMEAWIFRGVGLLVMWFGLMLLLQPMSVLFDVVPIFGTVVGAGVAFIAFGISLALSSVTIAVAWFAVRPALSCGLGAFAVLCLFLFKFRRNRALQ